MATATVTGNLMDFAGVKLNAYMPRIVFEPSEVAMSGQSLLATRRIEVTPNAAGGFEATLQVSDDVQPATYYTMRIQWLDAGGNYISADVLRWKLVVPPGGGDVGDLIQTPSNPSSVWIGESPPDNPTPGTWWLVPSTGNLYEWS